MNLAELGPFFAVHTHAAGAVPAAPWRRLSELLDIAPSGDMLRHRVTAIRGYLAAGGGQVPDGIPLRVAASVTQLGLTARLVSPVLGAAVLTGRLVDVDLDSAWWQPELGGTFPLSLPPPGDPPVDVVAGLVAVLNGPIRALVDATRRFSVSDRILWGNVASSVNGAATAIAATRPDLAGRAGELVSALLDREPLRDTGVRNGGRFRRRSCCLIYRAARGGHGAVCGDCVLS
ncbi:MAG TPA: (2Fe-2S)-binding protein [Pseudonocardiaceae bacterium]|nr:(2Fe-2S)-binding protein [Pseudonocardiaceae bacterium]